MRWRVAIAPAVTSNWRRSTSHPHSRKTPARKKTMAINLKNFNQDQLNELISKAKQRQNDLAKERAGKVRDKILALIKSERLSLDDLFPGRGRVSRRGRN